MPAFAHPDRRARWLHTRPWLRLVGTAATVAGLSASLGACSGSTTAGSSPVASSAATAASTGGGSTTVPGSSGSSTTSPTRATTADRLTLAVDVHGSTVTPAPSTVPLAVGRTMMIIVSSDHADEIHAHGFEVEKEVTAGGSATLELTGTEPGVYEVEMHHPALTLLKIAVS